VDAAAADFGALLRHWRRHRALTQEALALDAGVSTRHLSWLETGRAMPSRAMLLRLAERLDVPLRERNRWLRAAGFAPLYAERALAEPALAGVRQAVQQLLDAHEPWPALAVDRHWNVVAANAAVGRLLALLLPGRALPQPLNVLRLSLSPDGLGPCVVGLAAWRAHVLARLQRQIDASGDGALARLRAELQALPVPADEGPPIGPDDVVVPLQLRGPDDGLLRFVSTVTVFGAPHDVTTSELAVETLLPADAFTAERLRRAATPG
jgi:transcriptional regulator with XRE-family HTH domain